MTDVRPIAIARRQDGVVAHWQLVDAGLSAAAANRWVRGLRSVHDGVHVTGWGEITERQRWWAAVSTAPGTVLSHASAALLWGLWSVHGPLTTVTRPGSRGREEALGVLVSYSSTLDGDVTRRNGIPVTTVERTVIDMWPRLWPAQRSRMLREALRLKLTGGHAMDVALRNHRGRRGVATLRVAVDALSVLALDRCRSDAEAWAVALLADAGRPLPVVNARIAGEEADLTWEEDRLIIELDGPQFHVLRDDDVRKQRIWEAAGHTVRRLPTDVLYADPSSLLTLAPGRTSVRSRQGVT